MNQFKYRIVLLGSSGLSGGVQVHFQELEIFLRNEGHDVFTVKVQDGNELINCADEKSCFLVRSGNGGIWPKIQKAWDWFSAIQKAKAFQPDLFISTACGRGYANFGKALNKSTFGLFQIVTDDYRPLEPTLLKMLEGHSAVAVQSKGLIKPSRSIMNFGGALGVLPCFHQTGISSACAKPLAAHETLKMAYFGRLAGNKGLLLLLQVLSRFDEEPEWLFDIWGSGQEEDKLRAMIAGNDVLSRRITLKGRYPAGDDYSQLLANYHGLVSPSQGMEGLPLVLLEAASAGLPFLSCRLGAIGDCAEDNPDILIIETGEKALEQGLRQFIDDLRNAVYDNKRLKNWFDNNHTRAHYEQAWREMIASPKDYFKNE